MNQDSLSGEPRCYKTIGWALAVASSGNLLSYLNFVNYFYSGIGVSFLNGLLSRFVANLMSANRYEPTEKSSNPYNDNEAETNTDLTSMWKAGNFQTLFFIIKKETLHTAEKI